MVQRILKKGRRRAIAGSYADRPMSSRPDDSGKNYLSQSGSPGVDRSLIKMFLRMTPEERLVSNDNMVRALMELRNAYRLKIYEETLHMQNENKDTE